MAGYDDGDVDGRWGWAGLKATKNKFVLKSEKPLICVNVNKIQIFSHINSTFCVLFLSLSIFSPLIRYIDGFSLHL